MDFTFSNGGGRQDQCATRRKAAHWSWRDANVTASFPTAGYYRITASGPNGSKGWVTVDVGVTPSTAP